MKTLLCTLALATFGAAAAQADIVTITFDNPNQFGAPGQTLQFFGTIINTSGSTVFLNSDDLTPTGLSFTADDLFFSNVPFSLDPGESSGDIELFDITVSKPLLDPYGTYPGTYQILGGADGNAQDPLGTAGFSVTVAPEPSTALLLLVPLAAILYRRKFGTR